jgi:rhodanese-related sulfurtransferase
MLRHFHLPVKKALWQVPAMVALAACLALGVNQWRGGGIPLVGDWSVEARFADSAGQSLVMDLEQAEALFAQGKAQFVDARPRSQYVEGHIQGALSLPWQEVDRYFVELAARLDPEQAIVTYCDGDSCDLSHELAMFLKDMGFANVHVLVNGWTVWQEAGLPVDGRAD